MQNVMEYGGSEWLTVGMIITIFVFLSSGVFAFDRTGSPKEGATVYFLWAILGILMFIAVCVLGLVQGWNFNEFVS